MSELRDFPADGWDRVIKADAATGRLDFIDQQVTRTAEGEQLVLLDIVLRDGE